MKDKTRIQIMTLLIEDIIDQEEKFSFPEFLKVLRDVFGISQVAMAEELGFQALQIFHWERGNFKKPLPKETINKIADYMGVGRDLLDAKMMKYLQDRREHNG
jgi:transcriptional regulator with XRE-family HTH domain